MLGKKTVFILGAGASHDFGVRWDIPHGFPLGQKLLSEIVSLCINARNHKFLDRTPFTVDQCNQLAAAIEGSTFTTIDAFLGRNTAYSDLGRFMIAVALMPKERKQTLLNIDARSNNWMNALIHTMDCTGGLEDFRCNPVTFVTFNYDRSLDWYLINHLMTKYGEPLEAVEKVLETVPIIHVHGQLGSLREFDYGSVDSLLSNGERFLAASKAIQIIHEVKADTEPFKKACAAISAATHIAFLGFGFVPENMTNLNLFGTMSAKKVYATAKGVPVLKMQSHLAKMRVSDQSGVLDGDCLNLLQNSDLLL